jgi:hypothetical protein
VDEDGYVAGGRGIGVCVDNIMDVDAVRGSEESMSKAWERFAVEIPVLLLG